MKPLASDTAMVLAAGIGKRMRPLTATRPKPLVPVRGKALIDHALDSLADAGIARAVVNTHYLGHHLQAHLAHRKAPQILISDESDALLETGGGMVRADQNGLLPDTFFALNSDNIWLDGPRNVFEELSLCWDEARMDALLLLVSHRAAHNYSGMGDFDLDPEGRVSRRQGEIAPYIYIGVQLLSRRLLRDAPEGSFSTNILWNRAMEQGRLFGVVYTGEWIEVGEPGHIARAETLLARP